MKFLIAVSYDVVCDKLHAEIEKCACRGHGISMDKCLGECPVRKKRGRPQDSITVDFRKVQSNS